MSERFQSYEERFPVESQHLLGVEPFLQIERLKPGFDDGFRLHCAASVFSEAVQKYESKFPITALAIRFDGDDQEIDISKISVPERVIQLYLYCPNPTQWSGSAFRIRASELLSGLETLNLNELRGLADLTSSFPNLKSARLRPSDQPARPFWRTIENLEIFEYTGDLSDFGSFPNMRRLVIESSKLTNLKALEKLCPSLEVLLVRGHRKALDVSDLNGLKQLAYIDLDVGKQSMGLSDLQLPKLRVARLKFLGSPSFVENHPRLEWFKVKSYTPQTPPKGREGIWTREYGETGFGGFHVPDELR